jgi:hypothetical protein
MKTLARLLLLAAVLAGGRAPASQQYPPLDPAHPVFGTLQSQPANMRAMDAAGARAVVVGVAWDRYEPQENRFDAAYIESLEERIAAFRAAGKFVVLDLGLQYPPAWIFADPSAHFVDQYGHRFEPAPGSGDCGVNFVFSDKMRAIAAGYLHDLFGKVGDDFYAVRLGGGRYGELGYPNCLYGADHNCYWGFDPIAQGTAPGLPPGQQPCPVAGWKPGTPSAGHVSAGRFLEWYMASMKNYHDWQIGEVRRHFGGPLFMLYPSTGGLRPGQIAAAVADDCDGSTGPEKTGEIGRGFDTAQFVAGITDPKVVVYSTWVDGFPGCDDASADPARWSPPHFLASLAAAHQPPLPCGGENTGHPDDLPNLNTTFQRVTEDHLCVLFWAFEPSLFDGEKGHAGSEDFKKGTANVERVLLGAQTRANQCSVPTKPVGRTTCCPGARSDQEATGDARRLR